MVYVVQKHAVVGGVLVEDSIDDHLNDGGLVEAIVVVGALVDSLWEWCC